MTFKKGDVVVYGVHGRCEITGLETKTINKSRQKFYELKPVATSPAQKSTKRFLIPVETATESGLRNEVSAEDIPMLVDILAGPEYYFPMNVPWIDRQRSVDQAVRTQGAAGLAKAVSHLYAYHEKTVLPDPSATRSYQNLFKLLVREIAVAKSQTIKEAEIFLMKVLAKKPLLDQ